MATITMPPQLPQDKSGMLQRFAVERLKHSVSELQTLVDHDRRNQPAPPPRPTTLHLVTDSSALTTSVTEIKQYVSDESAKITVPLSVLDVLDNLKRGNDAENVSARETVRWFDRVLAKGGEKGGNGVKVQAPTEVYGTWNECLEWYNPPPTAADTDDDLLEIGIASPGAMTESMMLQQTTEMMEASAISPPSSPPLAPTTPRLLKAGTFSARNGRPLPQSLRKEAPGGIKRAATAPLQEPPSPTSPLRAPEVPRRIQPIINCALECLHSEKNELSKTSQPEGVLFLITNNPETSHWATCFGIPVLNTKELGNKIYEENRIYKEKKMEWLALQAGGSGSGVSRDNSGIGSGIGYPKNMDELLEVGSKLDPAKKVAIVTGKNNNNHTSLTANNSSPRGRAGNGQQVENAPGRRRNRNNQNAQPQNQNQSQSQSQSQNYNTNHRGGGAGRVGRAGYQLPFARNATYSTAPKDFNPNPTIQKDEPVFPTEPNTNGFRQRESPDYRVLGGAGRGVARGRGKLWTP